MKTNHLFYICTLLAMPLMGVGIIWWSNGYILLNPEDADPLYFGFYLGMFMSWLFATMVISMHHTRHLVYMVMLPALVVFTNTITEHPRQDEAFAFVNSLTFTVVALIVCIAIDWARTSWYNDRTQTTQDK